MRPEPEPASRLPIVLIALVVLAVAGYFGWRHYQSLQAMPEPEPGPSVAAVPTPSLPATPLPGDAPPAIQHPFEPPAPEANAPAPTPLPALAESDGFVRERLDELMGRTNTLRFLQLDGFVRRVVATVDNLGRDHAPVLMWPVTPTAGRFSSQKAADGSEVIHPDNAQRYTPLVQLIEAVDSAQAVALYRRLYPLCQAAYEELGFPGRYFNDRLVQVMDQLIATPVPEAPPAVALVQVKGEVPSTRPWVRYEYADPKLEAMTAGQKILLRVGADNQRRLQAKLKDLRARIARR
ncbi:MAG: DUF3014 domain-containing protein [Hydrogenophaga sp.]|uniref:DUF3014 domain-containing protein n=1 Tax=Hydrogenophaga sp. TaxID=1904254 RepID=UPI001E17EA86|nr:DUF3014 domain-containing protein [Hydrogenophaga sp.]MBX3611921.1 DUF3014 domain-containing protein [Hydrogenophaga sp.]